jgi:hypothetical protein
MLSTTEKKKFDTDNNLYCTLPVSTLINKYMEEGWESLAKKLHATSLGKVGKEKSAIGHVNVKLMRMLGSVREYYVDLLFRCANTDPTTFYKALGSTNVLSDYDLSIAGKDSAKVTWKMFIQFLKKYKSTLPYVFDTNLYPIGFVGTNGLKNLFYTEKINEEISRVVCRSSTDWKVCVNYAFIKLLLPSISTFVKQNERNLDKRFITQFQTSLKLDETLQKRKQKLDVRKKVKRRYNEATNEIIKRYYLTCVYAQKCSNVLYHDQSLDSFITNYCTASYYSIEAYYTPSSMNVVVLQMQGKFSNLKFQPLDYFITACENLGDWLKHLYKGVNVINFVKASKYLARICYAMKHITDSLQYEIMYNNLSVTVVGKLRGDGDAVSQMKEKDLLYLIEGGTNVENLKNKSLQDFIEGFVSSCLLELNVLYQKLVI